MCGSHPEFSGDSEVGIKLAKAFLFGIGEIESIDLEPTELAAKANKEHGQFTQVVDSLPKIGEDVMFGLRWKGVFLLGTYQEDGFVTKDRVYDPFLDVSMWKKTDVIKHI